MEKRICPECGERNTESALHCAKCEHSLPTSTCVELDVETPNKDDESLESLPNTITCIECNTENPRYKLICIRCGASLIAKEKAVRASNIAQSFAKPIYSKPHTGQSVTSEEEKHSPLFNIIVFAAFALGCWGFQVCFGANNAFGFYFGICPAVLVFVVVWMISRDKKN